VCVAISTPTFHYSSYCLKNIIVTSQFGPLELAKLVRKEMLHLSDTTIVFENSPFLTLSLISFHCFLSVATPEIAQAVHAECRRILVDMYDQEIADSTRILYGGSVTPESVDELMAQPDIDGALVGGASLDSSKFGRIINYENVLQTV
jgi:hypothetical protein